MCLSQSVFHVLQLVPMLSIHVVFDPVQLQFMSRLKGVNGLLFLLLQSSLFRLSGVLNLPPYKRRDPPVLYLSLMHNAKFTIAF